jgi:hypothetical protein
MMSETERTLSLCNVCKTPTAGTYRCKDCAGIANIRVRKLRKDRLDNGLCVTCGNPRDRLEVNNCNSCGYKENKRRLKHYGLKHKQERAQIKSIVFNYYSPDDTIGCSRCGISEIDVLQVHHINGGGNAHIKEICAVGNSSKFYQWLYDNGFPPEFEVLCANCHILKHRKK